MFRCTVLLCGVSSIAAAETGTEAETDTIVVTGERRTRGIQETSSSVVVETAERLNERSTDNINQLLGLLPNIQLGSEDQGPTIRGQDTTGPLSGADSFLGGTRPRTTVQIDGRAVGYNEFIYGLSSLWDVERVEVFRTPQTTTQGRNSIAGAIFIKTLDPTFEPEARVRGLIGNYDTMQLSGVVSSPILGEQVAARASFDWRRRQVGIDLAPVPASFGYDESDDNFISGRAKLLIKPERLPDLRLDVIYTHLETEAPQAQAVAMPFRQRRYTGAVGGYFRTNIDAVTGIAAYGDSEKVLVTLTPSYSKSRIRRLTGPGDGIALVDTKEFTFEGIVSAKASDELSVLAGVYHLNTDQTEFIDLTAFLGFGNFTDEQHSLGAFGELAFKPVPRLTVTGGLRYQRDRQDRLGFLGTPAFGFSVDYDRTFDAWLPKAAVAYELSNAVSVGLLAQRAFNPGGTTISFETGLRDQFEAETLWNYEAYVRARLSPAFQVNANLFYTDFDNAQRATTTVVTGSSGNPVFITDVGNVPAARSFGAELELDAAVTPRFALRVGLGLLKTKITQTPDPLDPIRGAQFARAPKVTASAAVDWRPLDGLRFDAQLRTNSRYFSDDANTPAFRVGGSTNVDAKLSYDWRAFTVSAYARNAFDEFAVTNQFTLDLATVNEPRSYGLIVEARF